MPPLALTSTSRPRPRLAILAALVGSVSALALAPAARAGDSETHAFHPVSATDRALLFRPRNVSVDAVRKASVSFNVKGHAKKRTETRRVPVKRVRRAIERGNLLKVSKPRHAKHGKLTIRAKKKASSTGSTTSSCTWGGFSASSMPGSCWRPYSDSSPFNRLVGGSPKLESNSGAMVNTVLSFGPASHMVGGVADTSDDWGQPIYFSQQSDPVYKVHCTESWGTCEVEGMQVRIPSAARPAGGGDAHMAVIDQAGGWEYDFWQVENKPSGGGTITISWGGRTAIGTSNADGLGSDATAAHFGLAAGLIRLEELRDLQINHALAMVVKCTNGTSVWPAGSGTGRSCSSIGLSNADAPAMGQHFYLAMSDAEINALAVPDYKKAILRALAHYGAFVRDTGGDSWGFSGESGSSYTSFGNADPWVTLGRAYGAYKNGSEYVFNIRDGVDWSKLRAVDPCVAQATC